MVAADKARCRQTHPAIFAAPRRRGNVHVLFTRPTVPVEQPVSTVQVMVPPAAATAATDHRRVPMDAIHNFRDMGGYRTDTGGLTRWRTLYRADGLYRATAGDVAVIEALGIRTVVDLRTDWELEERGTYERHTTARFLHIPILDATWSRSGHPEFDRDVDFLLWAYRDMLAIGRARFVDSFDALAADDALPAVFHCAAGKDRTGLLAALLLGSIGVVDDDIVDDYALTAEGMERMKVWAEATFPELADRMKDTPSAMLAALPDAMRAILDEIRESHGTIRAYVESIGVAPEVIDRLAQRLVQPS
jgi:protein-tyrosine phosphatase